MTDEELIAILRMQGPNLAADRIEELAAHAETMAQIVEAYREHAERLEEALLWCSGSADFNEGGVAREGWLKVCAPLLKGAALPAVTQPAPDAEQLAATCERLEAALHRIQEGRYGKAAAMARTALKGADHE